MKLLLTTTSFQDTNGPHHDLLSDAGFEIVCERGPLSESRMLELVGDIDAFCVEMTKLQKQLLIKPFHA